MAFDYENYYRLEYLESSGTQYIIIDYKPGSTTNLSCTFIPSSYADSANKVFGSADTAWNDKAFECYSWSSTWQVNWGAQSSDTSHTIDATNTLSHVCKITIENTRNVTFVIDKESFFTYSLDEQSEAWSSPNNLGVFCLNRTGGVSLPTTGLKILELVIDEVTYTPAQRISDSVLGLYDEVNNTFYTNAGTGTFIAGPIIVASPVSMEKGISIPATPSTNDPLFIVRTNAYGRGCAFTGLGYPSAAVSTSTVSVPSNNGAQSWTGTKNTFTGTGTCTGFDDEGFVNEGAAVTVTGLNAMIPAGMGIAKAVVADIAYNAVWNDIVDCIEVPGDTELEYGRAYCFDGEKFYFSTKYLDDGYIGIHSDTAGMFMGNKQVNKQLRVASAGFVLAYVDKTYPPGTPLTVAENGTLTKLKEEDIEKNPHKLVGTFWKDEPLLWWGFDLAWSDNLLVEVKGRKWIKVK